MSKGRHVLTPLQSLEFVRQRHNLPNGDIDRTARQRYFLTAAFRKIASAGTLLSPGRLTNLVNAVDKSLYVDSSLKIIDLARQMANLSANNIVGKTIPFEGFDDNSPVGSVEVIKPARVQRFVQGLINSSSPSGSTGSSGSSATSGRTSTATAGSTAHAGSGSTSSGPKPLDSRCIN